MSQLKAEYTANCPPPLPLIPRRPPHLSRPPCSRQPVSLVVRSLLCDASEHATSHQSKRPPAKTTSRQNDPGTVKTAPRSIYQWLCLYRCFACGLLETSVPRAIWEFLFSNSLFTDSAHHAHACNTYPYEVQIYYASKLAVRGGRFDWTPRYISRRNLPLDAPALYHRTPWAVAQRFTSPHL